jgi:hypothetical protein
MNKWIAQYVKGCTKCQQNKNLTKQTKVPLYRIPTLTNALPFQIVAMDLITQLPNSNGYDTILTIVDHRCTRAAVFLPCKTTITGQEVAKLYYDNIYRWFGLPNKVISDRDPRFTSLFTKALAQQLGIKQNMSSAFHPQTDRLSERTNQWVEQYLRLTINSAQTDWSNWLGIATMVHNNHKNATINIAPSEALLSYAPHLHPMDPPPPPHRLINTWKTGSKPPSKGMHKQSRPSTALPIGRHHPSSRLAKRSGSRPKTSSYPSRPPN